MLRKLTITVDDAVYQGLQTRIGRRNISRFLTDLARPHVVPEALEEGYRAMAADEEREREAMEWVDPGAVRLQRSAFREEERCGRSRLPSW